MERSTKPDSRSRWTGLRALIVGIGFVLLTGRMIFGVLTSERDGGGLILVPIGVVFLVIGIAILVSGVRSLAGVETRVAEGERDQTNRQLLLRRGFGGCMVLLGIVLLALASIIPVARTADAPIPLVVAAALLFGGAGFGLIFLGAGIVRSEHKPTPGKPWTKFPAWADDEIAETRGRILAAPWILAIFCGLMTVGPVYSVVSEPEDPIAFLAAGLFLLVASWLLWRAVRVTLRVRRHGYSKLVLETMPALPGQTLSGIIRTPSRLIAGREVVVRLRCERRVRKSGRGIVWEDMVTVSPDNIIQGGDELVIPFRLEIDRDVPPTNLAGRVRVLWEIEAACEMEGADWGAKFPVPVWPASELLTFEATSASRREPEPLRAPSEARAERREEFGQPPPSLRGVTIRELDAGRIVIEFERGRGPGLRELGASVVLLSAAAVAVAFFDFPMIFSIGFALLALALLYSLLKGSKPLSVIASSRGIQISRGSGNRTRRILARNISKLEPEIERQVGERVWWKLVAETRDGEKVIVGSDLESRREARWIASRIESCLHVKGEW